MAARPWLFSLRFILRPVPLADTRDPAYPDRPAARLDLPRPPRPARRGRKRAAAVKEVEKKLPREGGQWV